MSKYDLEKPPIYKEEPPEWLPKATESADLGLHGYFPPVQGQNEDLLTDYTVKNGYSFKNGISAEAHTAKPRLVKLLGEDSSVVPELENFMNEVFRRREENAPKIPPSTFRAPSRVTLNDAKRQAWFADLANPDVPLYKLGKSIPHGARGHDLLDLLHSNNVAIPRAVWFIRVFGYNETAGLRNKPHYNPLQYSVDWANIVCTYLKKQLNEIALPSAPRPGFAYKHTFKGVLSEPDSRERWMSRFSYSLELLRVFYSEGMVDHATFFSWLVHQMGSCNLAQASFVARLVDEFIDDILTSRALTRPLVEACLVKLGEISASSSRETLAYLEDLLISLVRGLFLGALDSYVNPKMWITHYDRLRVLMTEDVLDTTSAEPHIEQSILGIRQTMLDGLDDMETRNGALLFRTCPTISWGQGVANIMDFELLNSIKSTTDLRNFPFLDANMDTSGEAFASEINVLLTWCSASSQYGDHRPFAAATLLSAWRRKADEVANTHDPVLPGDALQDALFDWLDTSDTASDKLCLENVSALFGELIEAELFSYEAYLQRLVSRGEEGLLSNDEPGSRHRSFLRSIPLHKSTSALLSQRRLTLHGVRCREPPEDREEKAIREEISSVLPEMFGLQPRFVPATLPELKGLRVLSKAPRYEVKRVIRNWLMPALRKYFSQQTTTDSSPNLIHFYCIAVNLLERTKCYRSLLELSLDVLSRVFTLEILEVVPATLLRHGAVWACMNETGRIVQVLLATHHTWKTFTHHNRHLVNTILEMDNDMYLEEGSRKLLRDDAAHYALALCPAEDGMQTEIMVLPEILMLPQDPNPDAPSTLASGIWYRYRTSPDWATVVWDSTIASLQEVSLMLATFEERRQCAIRYAQFLNHVDQHLGDGLDGFVGQWLQGTGTAVLASLSEEVCDVVIFLLVRLCVSGTLNFATMFRGIVYPTWSQGADSSQPPQPIFLRAAHRLCQILLQPEESHEVQVPLELSDVQKLQTQQQYIYKDEQFPLMLQGIISLTTMEHDARLEPELQEVTKTVRSNICLYPGFGIAVNRNLNTVKSIFDEATSNCPIELKEPFMESLRQVLVEDKIVLGSDTGSWPSLFTPCRLASSAILIQSILKVSPENVGSGSSSKLDKLAENFFDHDLTSSEVAFLAEMSKGISATVAEKFLMYGLTKIATVLNGIVSHTESDLKTMTSTCGQLLILLCNIAKPFQRYSPTSPNIDAATHLVIFDALLRQLKALEGHLKTYDEPEIYEIAEPSDAVAFLLRVLHFTLGFTIAWTNELRSLAEQLFNVLFSLALIYGGAVVTDPVMFPMLLDSTYFIFDQLPIDPKPPSPDLYQHCPRPDANTIPILMPAEYRAIIRALLRYNKPDPHTADLVYAVSDASGKVQLGQPVQLRPWEWTENLGEAPEQPGERRKQKQPVKDNTSISLALFQAELTGEKIPRHDGPEAGPSMYFQDVFESESVFERDWRQALVDESSGSGYGTAGDRSSKEDEDGEGVSATAHLKRDRLGTPAAHRASPALSTQSHTSAHASGSASSRRGSPMVKAGVRSGSAPSDAIDVDDAMLSTTSGKRKASASVDTDDDIIVLSDDDDGSRTARAGKSKARKK